MNESSTSLQAVIFDLDGVITDTAKYHYQAWKSLADELLIPFDWEFNEQLKGIDRMASLEKLLSQLPDSGSSFTLERKQELAARKNERYRQLIEAVDGSEILPGILELFRELKKKGIRIGLASASRNAETLVRQLNVRPYFDVIIDPASVKRGKPAPDIYQKAAEALETPPAHCAGIEDAEAGVAAILGAGMFAVGVGNPLTLAQADYVVPETGRLRLDDIETAYGEWASALPRL